MAKLKVTRTQRGFTVVDYPSYPENEMKRLVQASSAIGDYEDSFEIPGSSYLWIGCDHHLDREEVKELIDVMQHWLDHKRLPIKEDTTDKGEQ